MGSSGAICLLLSELVFFGSGLPDSGEKRTTGKLLNILVGYVVGDLFLA